SVDAWGFGGRFEPKSTSLQPRMDIPPPRRVPSESADQVRPCEVPGGRWSRSFRPHRERSFRRRSQQESAVAAQAWGGRFQQATDPRVEKFTESISFDTRLAAVDIRGSQAHARMLAYVGLLTEDERDAIVAALDEIAGGIARCEMAFRTGLEDIHM